MLELLLVSPVKTGQIISGRLRGLWGQFLPSTILLISVWAYFSNLLTSHFNYGGGDGACIFFFAVTYVTVPVVGLYFSLRCRNFIAAFLLTLAVGMVFPLVAGAVVSAWLEITSQGYAVAYSARRGNPSWLLAAFIQIPLGGILAMRLLARLQRRDFPLDRVMT